MNPDHDYLVQELLQLVGSGDFVSDSAKKKLSHLPAIIISINALLLVDTILKHTEIAPDKKYLAMQLAVKNCRDSLDGIGKKLSEELKQP
jgi:hypothetical protein